MTTPSWARGIEADAFELNEARLDIPFAQAWLAVIRRVTRA